MVKQLTTLGILLCACASATSSSHAQDTTYEPGLMRISEVLGSLHFLTNLCGETSERWRLDMERLIDAEKPEPERRARFIANFNRGYRSFADNHTRCTPSADEAIRRYKSEGEALTRDLASRFGN